MKYKITTYFYEAIHEKQMTLSVELKGTVILSKK